jgi:ubiquinone biosynthesis protein
LAQLPQVARNLESLSQMAAEGGVKLHPETTRAIAEAEARGNRAVRYAIWLGAAALSLIALMQL